MDIRQLIEKMEEFAGEKVGQKSGDQWRGTDKGTPGKKLVGDSIIKDLSKGVTPKTKEQELAEEWATFSEENIGTHPKRAGRKSDRHSRGHEPQPRYKTVKADEQTIKGPHGYLDVEKNDGVTTVKRKAWDSSGPYDTDVPGGKYYPNPRRRNDGTGVGVASRDGIPDTQGSRRKIPRIEPDYTERERDLDEGEAYKTANPHPASKDPIVASVLKQMRPGLKPGLELNNEAFLYFAYELGKQRARGMWEKYGPAIKHFYQSGIGVNEGWESGPEEYEEPYDDADDAYDRQRQEKIDTEAEKEWAKLPKVSTYKLIGRGPNMEPNYEFGDEFDTLEQALEYRAEITKDPKTPHPEHIGIRTITRVKDQTNEAVLGGGGVKDLADYIRKRDDIYKQLADPKQKDNYPWFKQALFDLMRTARQKGIKIEESQAHDKLSKWFKDRDQAQKFASGKLKIPTPQERQAQLAKQQPKKEKVDEYGADNPAQATTQKASPAQAQQVAANLNTQKTALGQLKQLNPDINPGKAAMAATKDLATMNPQEKEELAQVAKTLTPALGSPAFGSIKTALQKVKNN